jgi:hypothetical protein
MQLVVVLLLVLLHVVFLQLLMLDGARMVLLVMLLMVMLLSLHVHGVVGSRVREQRVAASGGGADGVVVDVGARGVVACVVVGWRPDVVDGALRQMVKGL